MKAATYITGSEDMMNNIKNYLIYIENKLKSIKQKIKKHKWLSLLMDLLSTLILFAIAGGIGIFIALGKHAGSAENTAKEYFDAYINQSFETMYRYLDIEESEFINEEAFEQMMEGKIIYGDFSDAKVEMKKQKGKYAYVDITYTDDTTKEQITLEIKLKKQKKKIYKFFSTWKVDADQYIVNNYTIEAPEEADISFDLKDLKTCLKETKNGVNTYNINRLFEGEHTVGIDTVYIDAMSESLSVEKDDEVYSVNVTDFNMKKDDEDYVLSIAEKLVFGMYSNALNETGTDDLKEYFDGNEEKEKMLKECYDTMLGEINKENGATLKTMSVDTYKVYVFSFKYPSKAEIRVDFNCEFTAKTGRTMINGVRGAYEGTAASTGKVYFTLSDGKWVVDDMDITCFDYSPTEDTKK